MTDKESYVNVADLKRKLRAFAKYRQYSKPATDELLGVVSKLKISIKADLETTLESTDVQPVKRGRWLPAKGWFMSKCSECGYELGMVLAAGYICCPKCTARMDGDTE